MFHSWYKFLANSLSLLQIMYQTLSFPQTLKRKAQSWLQWLFTHGKIQVPQRNVCQLSQANYHKWELVFIVVMQTTMQLAVLIHHILVQLASGKVESYHLWLGNSSINLQSTYSFLYVILRNLKQLHCWQENTGPPVKYPKQLHLLIYDCALFP